MNYVVTGRKPEKLFRYFEELSQIPRGSGNEAGVADWLCAFADAHGLFCYRDAYNNVLIRKAASAGREKDPAILLQGHTDMVCEKNAATEHDFMKDPLRLAVKDGWLYAEGTTLGGDDGVAVAAMLTILDDDTLSHPTLECLFTVSEETGLVGAYNFDYGQITARTLINMDSEALGEITAGCAGGVRTDISLPITHIGVEGECLTVAITGLCGGHSGECIGLGRANAITTMGRLLSRLYGEYPFNLLSIEGGGKDNAIPRECTAVLVTQKAAESAALLNRLAAEVTRELSEDDKNFTLTTDITPCEPYQKAIGNFATRGAVAFLSNVTTGVMSMSHDIPGLVEFSRNLGVVKSEPKMLHFVLSTRSAIEAQLDASTAMLDRFAALIGAETKHYSRYPGWSYAKFSPIRDRYAEVYRRVTGKDARITVIHAGLECGIIKSHIPDMDIISVGPNLEAIHSPDEKLDLASFETFYRTIVETL